MADDDIDSLFGSRSPSPSPSFVAAGDKGRSPPPTLALPGLSSTTVTKNVGTIALPGLHVRSEQPRLVVSNSDGPPPPTTRSSPSRPPPRRVSVLKAPAPSRANAKAARKRKRDQIMPAPPVMRFPEPGEPIPPNFLRNHSAVLGVAGRVAGIRLPDPVIPSVITPVMSQDNSVQEEQRQRRPVKKIARPSPHPPDRDAATSALQRLEGNPKFIGVLRALLAQATKSSGSTSSIASQTRPLKRRRLSQVPAGAQDWGVPFQTEEPKVHDESNHEQQRSARLMRDLVSLLSDAVSKESSAHPPYAPSSASNQHAGSSSVQGWLDALSNTSPVESPSGPLGDNLHSLELSNQQSHEELFSALFGHSSPSQEPQGAFDPYSGVEGVLGDQIASTSAVVYGAGTRDVPMNDVITPSVPWPTPDPSEYSGRTCQSNFDEGENAPDSLNIATEETASAELPDWEDLLKSFLRTDGLSGSVNQPVFQVGGCVPPPPTLFSRGSSASSQQLISAEPSDLMQIENISMPSSNAVTTDPVDRGQLMQTSPTPAAPLLLSMTSSLNTADVGLGETSMDPTLLHLTPISQQAMAPLVAQESVRALSEDASVLLRPSKVEKKSELLVRAAAHRTRLADELERAREAIWGCTVEDSVLHRLRTGK